MKNNDGFVNIPIIIGLVFIIAVGGYFAFGTKLNTKQNSVACTLEAKICPDGSSVGRSGPNCEFTLCPGAASSTTPQTDISNWKTYQNEEGGYSFKYPNEWNVAINKFNPKNALFGPGATNESGIGGVEYIGVLSSGQSLSSFINEFNKGIESGSVSETETVINGNNAVISILPKASLAEPRETKSVSFEKDNKVFNTYLMYKTDLIKYPEDGQNLAIFDQILSTFKFTSPSSGSAPRIVDHFACSDYCPGPRENYMIKIYEGVTDEAICKSLGGTIYTYYGWGKFTVCKAQ
jgi:hypothetical protein